MLANQIQNVIGSMRLIDCFLMCLRGVLIGLYLKASGRPHLKKVVGAKKNGLKDLWSSGVIDSIPYRFQPRRVFREHDERHAKRFISCG